MNEKINTKNKKNLKKIFIILSIILVVISSVLIFRGFYIKNTLEKADTAISEADFTKAESLLNNLYKFTKHNHNMHLSFYRLSLAKNDTPKNIVYILDRAFDKTHNKYFKTIADDYRKNGLMSDVEIDSPSGHFLEEFYPQISAEDSDYGEYSINDGEKIKFEKIEQPYIKEKRSILKVDIFKDNAKKSFEYEYIIGTDLLDAPKFSVKDNKITITNIKDDEKVFYTTDESYPTEKSPVLTAQNPEISCNENHLCIKAYKASESSVSKTSEFIYKNPKIKNSLTCNMLNLGFSTAYDNTDYFVNFEKYPNIQKIENGKKIIIDICEAMFLNADEKNIFYSVPNQGIFSMNNSGGMRKKITDAPAGMMTLYAGKIFYIDSNDKKLYRIDKNGTNLIKITDFSVNSFSLNNNDLYFSTDETFTLYKVNINSKNLIESDCEKFADGVLTVLADNDKLLYTGQNGNNIYEIDYNSKESKLQIQAPITSYALYGNNLIHISDIGIYKNGEKLKDGKFVTSYMLRDKLYATYFDEKSEKLQSMLIK